jgi:hypothetical protein
MALFFLQFTMGIAIVKAQYVFDLGRASWRQIRGIPTLPDTTTQKLKDRRPKPGLNLN